MKRCLKPILVAVPAVAAALCVAGTGNDEMAMPAPLTAAVDFYLHDAQLSELVDTLLRDNPAINAAAAGIDAVRSRVPQARGLPDMKLAWRGFIEQRLLGGIEVTSGTSALFLHPDKVGID